MSLRTMSWDEAVTESTRKPTRHHLNPYVPPHLRYNCGDGGKSSGRYGQPLNTYVPPHLRYNDGLKRMKSYCVDDPTRSSGGPTTSSESTQYGFRPTYTGRGYMRGGRTSPSRDGGDRRGRGCTRTPNPSPYPTPNRDPFHDVSDKFEQHHQVSEEDKDSNVGINFDNYQNIQLVASGEDVPKPANTFQEMDLGVCLNKNIKRYKYVKPTPVQSHAIPIVMAGRDLIACAPTGSGKTAAFTLPIISGILNKCLSRSQSLGLGDAWTVHPFALILCPTTELARQIYEDAEKFAYQSGANVSVFYGGAPKAHQLHDLERDVDILIATPGRLVDMIERSRVSLKMIKYLALHETDRMLDMGFEPLIRKIVQEMDMPPPGARQTLLFSATFPNDLQRLAADFLSNYIFLKVGRAASSTNQLEFVRDMEKIEDHGTINVGFIIPPAIIIGVDSRTTCNGLIVKDDDRKFYELSTRSNMYCTAAGVVGPWDNMYAFLRQRIEDEEDFTNGPITVEYAKDLLIEHCREHCQENKDNRSVMYGTILVGWINGQSPVAYEIEVMGNRPKVYRLMIPVEGSSYFECGALLGSGSYHAHLVMLDRYRYNLTVPEAVEVALLALFHASFYDLCSGGGLHVNSICDGLQEEILSLSALEVYYKCFNSDYDRRDTIFLFQEKNGSSPPLTAKFIEDNWPVGELDASHMVAHKNDFYFFRVVLSSSIEGSRAFEEISRKKHCPPISGGKFAFRSQNLLFSLLPRIYLGNVRCYVTKKSKVLLRLMCDME